MSRHKGDPFNFKMFSPLRTPQHLMQKANTKKDSDADSDISMVTKDIRKEANRVREKVAKESKDDSNISPNSRKSELSSKQTNNMSFSEPSSSEESDFNEDKLKNNTKGKPPHPLNQGQRPEDSKGGKAQKKKTGTVPGPNSVQSAGGTGGLKRKATDSSDSDEDNESSALFSPRKRVKFSGQMETTGKRLPNGSLEAAFSKKTAAAKPMGKRKASSGSESNSGTSSSSSSDLDSDSNTEMKVKAIRKDNVTSPKKQIKYNSPKQKTIGSNSDSDTDRSRNVARNSTAKTPERRKDHGRNTSSSSSSSSDSNSESDTDSPRVKSPQKYTSGTGQQEKHKQGSSTVNAKVNRNQEKSKESASSSSEMSSSSSRSGSDSEDSELEFVVKNKQNVSPGTNSGAQSASSSRLNEGKAGDTGKNDYSKNTFGNSGKTLNDKENTDSSGSVSSLSDTESEAKDISNESGDKVDATEVKQSRDVSGSELDSSTRSSIISFKNASTLSFAASDIYTREDSDEDQGLLANQGKTLQNEGSHKTSARFQPPKDLIEPEIKNILSEDYLAGNQLFLIRAPAELRLENCVFEKQRISLDGSSTLHDKNSDTEYTVDVNPNPSKEVKNWRSVVLSKHGSHVALSFGQRLAGQMYIKRTGPSLSKVHYNKQPHINHTVTERTRQPLSPFGNESPVHEPSYDETTPKSHKKKKQKKDKKRCEDDSSQLNSPSFGGNEAREKQKKKRKGKGKLVLNKSSSSLVDEIKMEVVEMKMEVVEMKMEVDELEVLNMSANVDEHKVEKKKKKKMKKTKKSDESFKTETDRTDDDSLMAEKKMKNYSEHSNDIDSENKIHKREKKKEESVSAIDKNKFDKTSNSMKKKKKKKSTGKTI